MATTPERPYPSELGRMAGRTQVVIVAAAARWKVGHKGAEENESSGFRPARTL